MNIISATRGTLVLIVLTILSSTSGWSQLTLQAGVGVGAALPAGDYGGNTTDYYAGSTYGLRTGVNLHAKARAGLVGFVVWGEVDYSLLSNSGEAEVGRGKVGVKQKVLSFKAGPEYHVALPFLPITPYVGGNVAVNIFNGETEFQGLSRVPSGTYKMQSATRLGLGASAGVVLKIGPALKLDLAAHYNALNLAGKFWEDHNPLDDGRLDSYLALNDDKDPLYSPGSQDHFIHREREIRLLHFKATLMFGL